MERSDDFTERWGVPPADVPVALRAAEIFKDRIPVAYDKTGKIAVAWLDTERYGSYYIIHARWNMI
jgi:hypothetical protein